MDSGAAEVAKPPPGGQTTYFDGASNRRRAVTLRLSDRLEIGEDASTLAAWAYDDIRRADSPSGTLRLSCLSAPALARLEIRDAALAAEVLARCARVDDNARGRRGVAVIVGWSLAAAASIVA